MMATARMLLSRRGFLVGIPVVALSGCAEQYEDPLVAGRRGRRPRDLTRLVYRAIDHLVDDGVPLTGATPVVVASVTDVEHIEQTSRFGDLIAELARSRLAQDGVAVSEPTLRSAMLLRKNQGAMMLGRNPRQLVAPPDYSYVLTGTYAVGKDRVYVTLKLLDPDNARIVGSVDFVAWRNGDVDYLLT